MFPCINGFCITWIFRPTTSVLMKQTPEVQEEEVEVAEESDDDVNASQDIYEELDEEEQVKGL